MMHERRQNRSSCRQQALQFQLEATAQEARLHSVVLADNDGFVIASAGDSGYAEGLAAMSAGLSLGGEPWCGRIDNMSVLIKPFEYRGTLIFMTAVGDGNSRTTAAVDAGTMGVLRILDCPC